MIFVYPVDPMNKTKADWIYEDERKYAESLGAGVVLIDFDSMQVVSENCNTQIAGENFASGIGDDSQFVLYRGWMVSPERYENELFPVLCRYGHPVTDPDQYARMHSAENYERLVGHLMCRSETISYEDAMNASMSANENGVSDLETIIAQLGGKVFVKDYVKSVYGHTVLE